jgi:hypothetical protein
MTSLKEIERLKRCCKEREPNWVSLPLEGATLVACYLESSGKRGNMTLHTQEPASSQAIRLTEAQVHFWLTDEDTTKFFAVPSNDRPWELRAELSVRLRFAAAT